MRWFGICTCCGRLHTCLERPDYYAYWRPDLVSHMAAMRVSGHQLPCRKLYEQYEAQHSRWAHRDDDLKCEGVVHELPEQPLLEGIYVLGGWDAVAALWWDKGWDQLCDPRPGARCGWCAFMIKEHYVAMAGLERYGAYPDIRLDKPPRWVDPRSSPHGRIR